MVEGLVGLAGVDLVVVEGVLVGILLVEGLDGVLVVDGVFVVDGILVVDGALVVEGVDGLVVGFVFVLDFEGAVLVVVLALYCPLLTTVLIKVPVAIWSVNFMLFNKEISSNQSFGILKYLNTWSKVPARRTSSILISSAARLILEGSLNSSNRVMVYSKVR